MGNKYHARKFGVGGVIFDSKKEAQVWIYLCGRERLGEIKNLERQVRFELLPKFGDERGIYYIADYVFEENGQKVVGDCKSAMTKKLPDYVIKRKLFKYRYRDYDFREF